MVPHKGGKSLMSTQCALAAIISLNLWHQVEWVGVYTYGTLSPCKGFPKLCYTSQHFTETLYSSMKSSPTVRRSDTSTSQIFAMSLIKLRAFPSLFTSINWRTISLRKSPNTIWVKEHMYKHSMTAKPAAQQLRGINFAWIFLIAEFHCPLSQKLATHEGKDQCHLSCIC